MHDVGYWLSFQLAAEQVERELGLSWGAAQKKVMDLCERETLRWQNASQGGPDVSNSDLQRWFDEQHNRKKGGKRKRIIACLKKKFPKSRVPEPDGCPRKTLKADLLKMDNELAPLDEATLKKAIEEYNSTIRNDPNQIVSD